MTISLDTETDLIARGNMAPAPVCVSYARSGEAPGVALVDDYREAFQVLLAGGELILGANIAYDMAVLGEHWPDLLPAVFGKYARGEIRDIQLDQKAIDIAAEGGTAARKYSLAALCERHGLQSPDKDGPWRLEFSKLRGVPVAHWPAGAVEYVLADAGTPLQIHARQEAYAAQWQAKSGQPLLHLAGREAYKAFSAHLISCWGVHASAPRTEVLRARLDTYLDTAGKLLLAEGLVRPDGSRDTKAAKARMVAAVGEASAPRTDKGEVSLDKDACHDSGDDVLVMYSDYSQASTLLARVEDLQQGVDAPLQVRFDTLLETSRMSTSKPGPPLVGVQAQNFPRALVGGAKEKGVWVPGARECLEPRPGTVFVSADLPQAELRSIAQVCLKLFGYSRLGETLNAGRDPHVWFGGAILGLAYDRALELYHSDDARMLAARQQAKPCNFGFWGGMGAAAFQQFAWSNYRVRLTEDQAKHLKGVWMATIQEARAYFDWVGARLGDKDHMLVQHVLTGRWRGRVGYCAGCNTQFQEPTATAASEGLQETQRRAYTNRGSALWNSRTVLYTHDEIVMETPVDRAHDAALELSAVMAEAFTRWHPDVPAIACTGQTKDPRVVAPCVSRVYSKDMKPRWSDGRLVPWTPEGWSDVA